MKVKRSLVLIAIILLLIGTSFASPYNIKKTPKNPLNSGEPTLEDNAFQYNGEETWIEWWFFTMYDDEEDIQLCFSYSILLNETSGLAIMMVIGFDENTKYDIRNYYDRSEFYASYEKPDVSIGKDCGIETIDENTIIIKGKTQNGKISWNFTYNRLTKSYKHSGDFGWLCYLPGARVTGEAKINGVSYNIAGYGYHDHNWMTITNDLMTQWRWANTYVPNDNISIIFSLAGNFFFSGDLALIIGEDTIIFENPQIHYRKFAIDFVISQQHLLLSIFPIIWHIQADNEEDTVDFTINTYKNSPLYLGSRTYLVNEQVSQFTGEIKNKDATYSFNMKGFSEYTKFRIFDLINSIFLRN